jgi:hypothetical protein
MLRAIRSSLSLRKVALIVALAGVSGCSLNTDISGPAGIVKYSGDNQTAPPNTMLTTPLAVIVFTQFGERLQNVTVNWAITTGTGTLSAPSTVTDEGGIASVNFTTGATTGLVAVQARVSGIPALTFSISVN